MSHVLLYRHSAATDEHKDAAMQTARRAVELDPDLAEAWTAQGAATTICCDFASAEAAFRKATRLGPDSFEAHYYYGRTATEMGQLEKAAQLFERAAEIEPDDCQALVFAGQAYQSLGQTDRALDAERRALVAAERAVARDPTDARALTLGATGLIHAGRPDEARAWIERANALEPEESYVQYNSACAYVTLGEYDTALDLLEKIDFCSMASRGWIEHDPGLDPLRAHPRFQAIIDCAR
jgi:adenylate cyclase